MSNDKDKKQPEVPQPETKSTPTDSAKPATPQSDSKSTATDSAKLAAPRPETTSTVTDSAKPAAPQPDVNNGAETWTVLFVVLFWGAIALVGIWLVPGGKQFLMGHKIGTGIVAGVLIAIGLVRPVQQWFHGAGSTAKAGLGIFGVVPASLLALALLFFLPESAQVAVIRSVLLILLCLLPGSMYFLFIATKKYSLVDEFLNHVKRLGLVDNIKDGNCPPEAERRDVRFYINKFEAVLGKLPEDARQRLLEGTSSADSQQSTALTELFTRDTLLPVILTTLLIALCWLVTLPPWQGTISFKHDQPSQESAPPPENGTPPQTALERSPSQPQLRNLYFSPSEKLSVVRVQQQEDPKKDPGTQPAVPANAETDRRKTDPWFQKWLAVITPLPIPEFYAFLGAYFFSLQMLFRRYARRDLRPSAYVNISIRIVIAIIGTWAAIQVTKAVPFETLKAIGADDTRLLVLGFVIGVFPRVAWQVINGLSAKLFGSLFRLPSFETKLPISDIDGLTSWHEARLEEEDIENVPNMATADIVDLILNTRIPTDRIVDWMDQAILYTHIGPEDPEAADTRRKRLRKHGIYTASALVKRYKESETDGTRTDLELIFGADKPSAVLSLVDAVQTNPNLMPIMRWRNLC
jgi:hypothetical protein